MQVSLQMLELWKANCVRNVIFRVLCYTKTMCPVRKN